MAKKIEKAPRLEDRREYAEELAKLDRVRTALKAASESLERLTMTRLSAGVGRYLNRARNHWDRNMSDQDFDQLALKVAACGEIEGDLARTINLYAPAASPLDDEYDREAVEKIEEAQRFASIFKRALALQERRVLEQKNIALADIREASRGERQRIAREVAGAAIDLINALNEENGFFERLKSIDEALPAMMQPSAFPIEIGPDPDSPVCTWLALAFQISHSEVRKLMKNVAPQEVAASSASAGGREFLQ